MQRDNEQLETLAHAPKRTPNTEEPIPHVDEAIKQSDVMDHLKKVGADEPSGS